MLGPFELKHIIKCEIKLAFMSLILTDHRDHINLMCCFTTEKNIGSGTDSHFFKVMRLFTGWSET